MNRKNEVVAALDLGTTKVTVLVAEVGEGGMSVLGVGTAESEGLRKGMVTSIGKAVEAIRKARHDAEQMSGYMISQVVAGVGGTHVVGVNNHAMVSPKQHEITKHDVRRVLDLAMAFSIPVDREVINVLPQQYVVDEHDGIRDPVGMSGVRLDVDVHLITAARAAIDNIQKCAERSGLQVVEFVANPLASALAVLEDNERELGVCVLDLGGGSGDLAIWANGSLLHTGVIGAGGNLITRDIATGLRTPAACAEELKVKYGSAWGRMVAAGETIDVPSVGGRPDKSLSRHVLTEIIEPRVLEIFGLVRREIQKTGLDDLLAGGLVLSGGAAQMPGMVELGDELLNLPVRLGVPRGVKGLTSILGNPALATAYGLAVYAALPFRGDVPEPMLPVRQLKSHGGVGAWFKKAVGFLF
ncbi:MAG: cell division protein FtsA [Deltaproteobacteria bacterium]|nr:cell division protein FtsA [Deltaproteobacteria bacterium]